MIDPSLTDPGEKLIWSGHPSALRYALRMGAYQFLFGLFFFGFSVFWIYGAAHQSGMEFALFGIPFLVIGAGMALSPLWHIFRGRRTTYARRAIMDISGPFPRRTSVLLSQITFVDVRSSGAGPGHVLFQESISPYNNSGLMQRDGFVAIADAAQVGQMLRAGIERAVGGRFRGPQS